MIMNMDATDSESFEKFIERHWGNIIKQKETVQVSAGIEEQPKRRGRKPKTQS